MTATKILQPASDFPDFLTLFLFPPRLYIEEMEKVEAVEILRARALEIGQIVTTMHPLVGQVADPAAKGEMLRALFELTKQVEVIKKQALRLQKHDESRDL